MSTVIGYITSIIEGRFSPDITKSYQTGGTVPLLGSIGRSSARPASRSNIAPAPRRAASPRGFPTICNPTARPNWSKSHGIDKAGDADKVTADVNKEAPM